MRPGQVMTGGQIDVGEQFGTVFTVAFYAACITFATGVLHLAFKSQYVKLPARSIAVLSYWVLMGTVIYGLVMRFQHAGEVCSGDFLEEGEST